MTPRLPLGFAVALDARARWLDGGAALLGGSPLRLLRLRPAARELLAEQTLRVRDDRTAGLARQLLDAGVAHPRPAAAPCTAEVTVVIPVRDNVTGVERVLTALGAELPVIVVDDGSTELHRLRRVVEQHGAQVVRHPVSRGPAAARNTGLAQVRTQFVAFLDSDVVPAAGWLPPLLAHLSDPAVAVVAPRITALDGPGGWIARYEKTHSSLDLGPREAPVLPHSRVAYVPSAALLLRTEAVTRRGFDESMPVAEDVDLCWWLQAQGWRLRYEPAAAVAHQHRTTTGAWFTRKAFYGTGAASLAARHPGKVSPLVLAPWTALACALLASATPGGLIGAAALTAASAVRISRSLPGLHHPLRLAALLAARGLGGACAQLAAAACRSYWPVSVALALRLPRARRVLVVAAVVEGLADWVQHRGPGGLGPLRYLTVKRLDDLAYGSGLWCGAVRAHNAAALRPSIAH